MLPPKYLLVATALCAVASSQTPQVLIGLTSSAAAGSNLYQQNWTTCAVRTCVPAIPPIPSPFAGGTAFNALDSTVWLTNGVVIGSFDADTCAVICPLAAVGGMPAGAVATGLAVNERNRSIYISDSMAGIQVRPVACPLPPGPRCVVFGVPATHTIGGLAYSDAMDLLFIAASDFNPANPPLNTVLVTTRANPCTPVCVFRPPTGCGGRVLGPIRGAAYDDCKGVIWLTDGLTEMGLAFSRANCGVQPAACCVRVPPVTQPYAGLCIRPSHAGGVGVNCTGVPCPACPTMAHVTIGDPTIGNPAFRLVLANAPAVRPAILAVGFSGCTPGIALPPPWCGLLHIPLGPPPVVIGPISTAGGVGCTGGITVNLGVPMNPAFCGMTLSSQYLGYCLVGPAIGTFMSNCLSWTITSS
jgi:hypothetical protein